MIPNGTPELCRGFASDELSHTGDLECCFLDEIRHFGKRRVFRKLRESCPHNAGTGYAYVDDAVRLSYAVKRAGHKRIVFRRVAEDYQLCSADALPVACQLRRFLDHVAHHLHGIHVDTGFCRTDIDGRADEVRFSESSSESIR